MISSTKLAKVRHWLLLFFLIIQINLQVGVHFSLLMSVYSVFESVKLICSTEVYFYCMIILWAPTSNIKYEFCESLCSYSWFFHIFSQNEVARWASTLKSALLWGCNKRNKSTCHSVNYSRVYTWEYLMLTKLVWRRAVTLVWLGQVKLYNEEFIGMKGQNILKLLSILNLTSLGIIKIN